MAFQFTPIIRESQKTGVQVAAMAVRAWQGKPGPCLWVVSKDTPKLVERLTSTHKGQVQCSARHDLGVGGTWETGLGACGTTFQTDCGFKGQEM